MWDVRGEAYVIDKPRSACRCCGPPRDASLDLGGGRPADARRTSQRKSLDLCQEELLKI